MHTSTSLSCVNASWECESSSTQSAESARNGGLGIGNGNGECKWRMGMRTLFWFKKPFSSLKIVFLTRAKQFSSKSPFIPLDSPFYPIFKKGNMLLPRDSQYYICKIPLWTCDNVIWRFLVPWKPTSTWKLIYKTWSLFYKLSSQGKCAQGKCASFFRSSIFSSRETPSHLA